MSYLRNPHIKRIMAAMQAKEVSPQDENLCLDDPLHNVVNENSHSCETAPEMPSCLESESTNCLCSSEPTVQTNKSALEMQPQLINYAVPEELRSSTAAAPLITSYKELVGVNNVHPENEMMPVTSMSGTGLFVIPTENCLPSSRPRSDSSSSGTSSSTSTSSSSSSSTSSGKDFSPDEADNDPDYVEPVAPTRRVSTSSSSSSLQHDNGMQQVHIEALSHEVMQEIDSIQQPMIHEVVQEADPIQQPSVSTSCTRKRKRNISKIKEAKMLRNSGKQYTSLSKSKRIIPKREIGLPCGDKCRLKCTEKITQQEREFLFEEYWKLGDLTRQRDFLAKFISVITPRYQYKVHSSNRGPKHSFCFEVNNVKIRVCKLFFKSTLAINNRPIATVIAKKNKSGIVEKEKRGKHGKHNEIDSNIKRGIKRHIDSIPRIESHYLRQQTTREYIEGGKNLTDLYKDYQTECITNGEEAAKIHIYRQIFNEDYNISFFKPKKDQCELCTSYKNDVDHNTVLQAKYEQHQIEKELSRKEKANDKALVNTNHIVACYDLQAVLPLPKGEVSTLYYKCKLNVFDFTISELANDYCDCFVWSEVDALRRANEIATCVFKYLTNRASEINNDELQVTFYSDNCCGQQKNQFMFAMYMYAVSAYKIKSITHKFLISGHTQNENDSVHSVIEKAVKKRLRSGPMYVPDDYINVIKSARKKGNPYKVNPMCYSDFIDIKSLSEECGGRFSKNTLGETVRLSDIKVIKFEKVDFDNVCIYYKTSFSQTEFKEIEYYNSRSSRLRRNVTLKDIQLKPLYHSRIKLSERKKNDLKSLIQSNIIPQYYAISYYNNILE